MTAGACATDDVAFHPATALAAALRRGEIGSRELLEHYLARIERTNVRVNAVVTLVGPYLEDRTTVDFAARLAEVVGGYAPPPDC